MPTADSKRSGPALKLFNSLGRDLQEFQPRDPRNVGVYSCGPTVYDYAHIGNLRAYVFTDTLRRVLNWKGFNVTHVINITDVGHLTSDADAGDDKMEVAARRQAKSIWDIAAHYTQAFKADLARLNILPPSLWCTATSHIQEMIGFARTLDERGFTYALEDGLYFDTRRVPDYGRLALLNLEGQESGKRVAGPQQKRNPSDFAVWRVSPKDKQRLMEWHSPWGTGAPGWHLECSVMSIKYLGGRFDIHTGGVDHRQVHHCNEIAQNQGYLGGAETGARFWLHNDFLVMRDDKMSKSAGNFLTLQSLVDRGIHPTVYRLFLLGAAYRSQLEFSWDAVLGARSSLRRLLLRIAALKSQAPSEVRIAAAEYKYSSGGSFDYLLSILVSGLSERAREWVGKLDEAISDDLHTPGALAHLNDLVFDPKLAPEETLRLAQIYDLVLGLDLLNLSKEALVIRPVDASLKNEEIEALILERVSHRKKGDYAGADRIRDKLQNSGVAIMDSPAGTTWEWLPHQKRS